MIVKVWQWSPMILQVEIALLFPIGRLHGLPSWPKFLLLIRPGYNPPAWEQLRSGCTVCLRIFTIPRRFPSRNGAEWNFTFLVVGFHRKFPRRESSKYPTDHKGQKQAATFFRVSCYGGFRSLREEEFSLSQLPHRELRTSCEPWWVFHSARHS